MKHSNQVTRARVDDEVFEYLVQHPDAQDTLEGVCDWWLLERRVRRSVAEVEAALGKLVARGFVAARRGKDGNTHYRLNRREEQRLREPVLGCRGTSRSEKGASR
ncbi:MAG TPA: hypothetical protein PKM43_19955 [Verrucomicrobiota bacterium]|nr:hypothetical protein [Verrucomicrobiota bacterium]HRZ35781.1 hypothetical protein [Candidatus Paceibacterota bacterium]